MKINFLISIFWGLCSATAALAQTQPTTQQQVPANQINPYYAKQVQKMSLENLSEKDREKFEKGYEDFLNSAKMTPTPKVTMPSKEEINKRLIEAGKR